MAKITDYKIILSSTPYMNERRAAEFLRESIMLICGARVEVLDDSTPVTDCEIVVGKTKREQADGLTFVRSEDRMWEYEIKTVGKRLYLIGLGEGAEPKPFGFQDGCIATVYAAYRFAEDVLGYYFLDHIYHGFEEKPDLEMPADYNVSLTKEFLAAQLPEKIDGAAMYAVPSCHALHANMCCIIYKTAQGKLILVDGGHGVDTEHVLQVMEALSGGKKPVISAMLFSHVHSDHYGFFKTLLTDPTYADRVTIEHLYCHLMDEAFYTTDSKERAPHLAEMRALMVDCENRIGTKLHVVEKGDHIVVDEFDFEVLHVPQDQFRTKMNMNDSSVVYKMDYNGGEQTMMLLGDAEYVCSNDLIENAADKLKCDIVQVGHHGCGNVSEECYRLMGADIYIWQAGVRYWYSDDGEGLESRNIGGFRTYGMARTRLYINEAGGTPENQYKDTFSMLSFKLPIQKRERGER